MSLLDRIKTTKTETEKDTLESELKEASQRYYSDGTSEMSDPEFDSKLARLRKIDPSNEVVTSIAHGYDIDSNKYGVKREHPYCIVGSLDKVREWESVSDRLKDKKVVCSLKLDGISCALYYKDGKLDYALTRGNGAKGIDITDKLYVIAPNLVSISLQGNKFTGAIRGELLMSFSNFKEFEKLHPTSKNPRNSVAGLINQKDYDDSDLRFIDLVLYSIMACDDMTKYDISDYCSVFTALNSINPTAPWNECECLQGHTFDQYMRDCRDMFNSSYDYPSDGIVIAGNSIVYDEKDMTLNWESQAYKFPSEYKMTSVKNVEWNLSKTGYLVPKVKFDAIELAGTTVEYATGFNAKYIRDNDIQPGCDVMITKSGEIIPYIAEVCSTPDTCAELPECCPSCGDRLQWDGVNLACKNAECPGQELWDLMVWMKTLAPVDGLSDALIEKFANALNMKTVEDLYKASIDDAKRSIVESHIEGKQSNLFISSMSTCHFGSFSIDQAVKACNIPRFGDKTSKLCIGCEEVLLDCVRHGFVSPYNEVYLRDRIGESNCDSLIVNERKLQRLSFISDRIVKTDRCETNVKGDVCITGKLSMKRKDFEDILRKAGYNPVSKVKKDTMFLITDNPESGSSKNKDADKYGVAKITENVFTEMYL